MSDLSIDDIVGIEFQQAIPTLVPSVVRNVALLVPLKVGATEPTDGYAKVTSKVDADLLTDFDTAPFFNAGFQFVFLIFDKTKTDTVNNMCRTLINTVDSDFTGVTFKDVRVALLSEVNPTNTTWVNTTLNCGVLDNQMSTLINLFITFLKQQDFTSLQYINIASSPVANRVGAFENKYTYFDYDQTSIIVPLLANFKIGGGDAKDIYLNYEIKEQLQQQLLSNIQTGRLPYTDSSIAILEASARGILQGYLGRGLIDGYTFNIPRRSQNLTADIVAGVLKAIDGTLINTSSIWRMLGTMSVTV
jgi:hypothetical protein